MLFDLRIRAHRPAPCRRLGASLLFALAFGTAYAQFGYIDIHDFSGSPDGADSVSSVTFDTVGNAYGTTFEGGTNNGFGVVWEVTTSGAYKVIHDFGGTVTFSNGKSGTDGEEPFNGVSLGAAGNLYGTTYQGGGNGYGIVWEITSGGTYKDLHDFGGTVTLSNGTSGLDGVGPYAGVTVSSSSNLFGDTNEGGGSNDEGMVWEITSSGVYKDLHDFGGTVTLQDGTSGSDGKYPSGNISFDSTGNMYGTAYDGGGNGYGNIWEITSGAIYKDLHDFGATITLSDGSSGTDGIYPYCGIAVDSSGNLYGNTDLGGGPKDDGMVWEIQSGGIYKDLHDFGGTTTLSDGGTGNDGANPYASLTLDSTGDIFGTAEAGGGNSKGMVFEVTAGGVYIDLHDFGGYVTNANGTNGLDGESPYGGVTADSRGNYFGTTHYGGPSDDGMIWELARPPDISSLSLNPSTIGGLGTTTATLTLATAAPSGGTSVEVHAGASGYLNMPATVTVPAGATTATFTITGLAQRPSTLNMGVFASNSSNSVEAILNIQGDSLKSFTLSPSQIKWTSGTSTATLTIGSAAPPGGWIVTLTPGVSGYVNMPTTVTIPAGSTSTTCSITGNALRFFTLNLGITARDGGSKATSTLVIVGDAVKSLSLIPSTIGWGGTSTVTVNLVVAAPPGGWLVITNPGASGYVSMPTSITVPAGAMSATFTITAGSQRSANLTMGIYANDGPSNQSATLTIDGDSVKSLTLNPSTITALGSSTATVTLASAAPPGGWVLSLHPGASGYVSMPSTLTVPAGATTATFTITGIVQHSSTIDLGIFVSDGNSSQEAILTIT